MLGVLLGGCLPGRQHLSLRNKSGSAAINQTPPISSGNQTRQDIEPYKPNRQFGVFDQKYDFVKDGRTTAAALAERFPVHADEQSEVAVLETGADFLAARLDLLDSAQKTVDIQLLVWHGDEAGWKLTEKILELKARGVNVRLIVDPVNNIEREAQSMFFKMKQSGIHVEGWETLYLYVLNMYRPSDDFTSFVDEGNRRYHEKMFIVDAGTDNAQAIVGGTNIGNKYYRLDPRKPLEMWRDKDVIVRGPIVTDIATMFENNLTALIEFRNNKAIFNTEPIWVWVNYARNILKLDPMRVIETPTFDPVVIQNYNAALQKPRNLQWKPATMRYLHSRPRLHEKFIHRAYIDFIESAKSEILILNSYFLPLPEVQVALHNAVLRGVNVKILANHKDVNDLPIVTTAARTLYKDLLAVNNTTTPNPNNAKLEIYEWGGEPVFKNNEGMHHGKYAIFDRTATIVGSFNLDPRSTNLNSECVVAYEDVELSETLAQEFEREIAPEFSENISYSKALTFNDPKGFLGQIETLLAVSFKANF